MTRAYRMTKRAEAQSETRRRIARAVFDLHATVGPARTTVSGIADHAGVDRVTVYRHFPDERSLYRACLDHWTAERPLPDPESWRAEPDGMRRLRLGLEQLYAHYETNEGLWSNGWRDIPRLPLLRETDEPVFERLRRIHATLLEPWARHERDAGLAPWLGHAIEFGTWESFVRRQQCSPRELVELVLRTTACLTSDGERSGARRHAPPRARKETR
jgi:AcrR family transcriptional regulator